MGKNKKKRRSQQRYPVPKPSAPVERVLPEEPIAPAAPVPAEESVNPVVSVPTEEPVDLFEAQTTLFEPAVTEELSAPPAQVSETEPQQTTQITENNTNREEPSHEKSLHPSSCLSHTLGIRRGGGLISRSAGKMTDMTVLTEAQDLNAVIDHFLRDPRFSSVCLWGESQGGFVSSYVAASRPEDIEVLALEYPAFVLVDTARASRREDGTFPETGRLLGMKIGRAYYEALAGIDIYAHIQAYQGPVLILHGDRDRLVPLSYSERALEAFAHAELVVMPGQGHGFLFSGRREAMEKELSFFRSVCE